LKIIIFGASGRTGLHLIKQALERGHEVTAFARTPNKISIDHDRLHIIRGNVHDARAVEKAIAGQEVVLCASGTNQGEPATAFAEGTRNILTRNWNAAS